MVLEHLYVLISRSFVHARWVEIQQEMHSSTQVQFLSDTRWACRYAAYKAVCDRLPALMRLLSDVADSDSAKRSADVKPLLNTLDCQLVLMLLFMCEVLGQTHYVTCLFCDADNDCGE